MQDLTLDVPVTARARTDILKDLEDLVQERGFIYSLAVMLRHDLFLDPAEALDIDWRSRLSYQEFSFLAGLLVKRPLNLDHPSEEALSTQVRLTYTIFEELHAAQSDHIMKKMEVAIREAREDGLNYEEATRAFFGSGDVMTEPIFYSGSGAYDFQYWTLAPARYELDREWLAENVCLSISAAADITQTIKHAREARFDSRPQTFEEFLDAVLELLCFTVEELERYSSEDVESCLKAFSLEPGTVNESLHEPGQYNRLDSHPLIELGGGRYFAPVLFNLARSLYESPFYWMIAEEAYRDVASANRGETTERLTAEMLGTVFGDRVHRGVTLRRGTEIVGEIDVLASVGRKGLIVQCKSKRLTELARRGDTKRLEDDFAGAVQSAYEQGLSCRDLLRDPEIVAVVDGAEELEIELDDAFVACVVSDQYPSLTHQVHAYLRRPDGEPYPIALSVFDLELVCHYLRDPFEFMYYVRQRIELAEYFRADEEMSLLAFHLKNKRYRQPGVHMVSVASDMAQYIDANYPAVRGEHPATEASERPFHEWKNEKYDRLVEDLKSSDEPGFVDAVFMLFDFSSDAIDQLVDTMDSAKATSRADGREHSLATLSDAGTAGISFVTRPDNPQALDDKTLTYARLKKYQTRAKEWLGLGSLAASDRLGDVVVYNRDDWEPDQQLEEAVTKYLKHGTAKRLAKKLGRNDPCYCGSGLKFKRCHGQ